MAKAYEKLAETYTDAVFLKLYGNANPACKALFKQFKIRSTPSFLYFRHGGWWRQQQQPAAGPLLSSPPTSSSQQQHNWQ